MTTDQGTTKAPEALRDAKRLAEEHPNSEVDTLHPEKRVFTVKT
jgi:hypothetical protein